MYNIVIVGSEVTHYSEGGRVETSGDLQTFETIAALQQYISTNNLTLSEGVEIPEFDLAEYKANKVSEFSLLAFDLREAILPEYKLVNAGLGIYDEATVLSYKLTVQAFRDEFYRLSGLIDEATTKEAIDAIEHNYPNELVTE